MPNFYRHRRFTGQPTVRLLLLITLLTTVGCTSPLVLGRLYDRIPNSSSKSVARYADFNKAQTQVIKTSVQRYHRWHRETQLPEYAVFLRSVANSVNNGSQPDRETVAGWLNTVDEFSSRLRQCNPLNDSADLLAGLSDKQVQQIATQLKKEKDLELKEYQEESEPQRRQRRYKFAVKWARRIGLPLNPQQKALLQETLKQQQSLGLQRMSLWRVWSEQFINLLQNRHQPEFNSTVNPHIHALWSLTKDNYPNEWQHTKALWQDFLYTFMAMQSEQQNKAMEIKLNAMAEIGGKLSRKAVTGPPAQCFRLN